MEREDKISMIFRKIYLQPAEASETRIQLPGLEEEVKFSQF